MTIEMERRILGRTGISVTPLGFGSQTIGGLGYGEQNWDESQPTIETYLRAGGRLIDTARGYGVSEIYIGKALRSVAPADQVIVCSKSGATHPPIIRADMEVSRFCLQRDYIDVYYVHVAPNSFDALRRVLDAYEQFKHERKVHFIGVSASALMTSEERDLTWKFFDDGRIDVMQFPYSMWRPEVEPLLAEARRRGIGVVVRQALEGGMLSDKFRPGHRFTDRANDWRAGIDPQRMEQALQQIDAIRRQFVRPPFQTMAQLALAFVLANHDVCATIPGAGSPEEMRDNLSVNDLPPLAESTRNQLATAAGGLLQLMRSR